MKKKGAIDLSINTIVIVIISFVILSSGIALLYKFITQAEEIKGDLDSRTEAELERLLVDQGQKVALPLHTQVIPRGESHTFGLGILNIGDVGNQFQINVELSKVLQEGNIAALTDTEKPVLVSQWFLYNSEVLIIPEAEHHKEAIFVQVPDDVPNGQYIFNVRVFASGIQYGSTQRLYVTVSD
ncbi:hypothetical protein J4421_01980 [Candidatus Woesearchaeota archaeon]|nr:hypothetical protein [Candidatus Woesearchaeota archaeon]